MLQHHRTVFPHLRSTNQTLLEYAADHQVILVMGLLYLLGVCLGVENAGYAMGDGEGAASLVRQFLTQRIGQDPGETMLSAFWSSFILMPILFFSGFSAIGIPVIAAVPFFKGLGFGMSTGSIIRLFGTDGIPCILSLIPNGVLSAILILYSCRESFSLSSRFCLQLTGQQSSRESASVIAYCVRFFFYVIGLGLSAALEGILFVVFVHWFPA